MLELYANLEKKIIRLITITMASTIMRPTSWFKERYSTGSYTERVFIVKKLSKYSMPTTLNIFGVRKEQVNSVMNSLMSTWFSFRMKKKTCRMYLWAKTSKQLVAYLAAIVWFIVIFAGGPDKKNPENNLF